MDASDPLHFSIYDANMMHIPVVEIQSSITDKDYDEDSDYDSDDDLNDEEMLRNEEL